jgi:hypothetical protein
MTAPRQPTRLDRLHHRWFLWRNYYTPRRKGWTILYVVIVLAVLTESIVNVWAYTHPQCTAVAVAAPHGATVNGRYVQPRGGIVTVRFCGIQLREEQP